MRLLPGCHTAWLLLEEKRTYKIGLRRVTGEVPLPHRFPMKMLCGPGRELRAKS